VVASQGENHRQEALAWRTSFEAGEVLIVAPPLLFLEILNAFGRRWQWAEQSLVELARALVAARFEVEEPDLESIARWTARGLSASDAAYVALAESRGIELVTADETIIAVAPAIARSLTS
jgi:predicted nucleic acid-binding protein